MKIAVRSAGGIKVVNAYKGDTLLDVLQREGIAISATCGGKGSCGRCCVLVRDQSGISYKLACNTPAQDGMRVAPAQDRNIEVSLGGDLVRWEVDDNGWGYGVAIDIGTTTLVSRLYNLETGELLGTLGRVNPQVVYGVDGRARILAAEQGQLENMSRLLGDELVQMVGTLVREAGLCFDDVENVIIAGNTTMQHIAMGIDPSSIGIAPFQPVALFGGVCEYLALEENDIAAGSAYFAPCISGHVGGDIVCGLLALNFANSEELRLVLDLGTEGGIALGNKDSILTCSTSVGSVFEGASVKYGMPDYSGAIDEVAFEGGKLRVKTIGGVDPEGLCASGLIDAVALMLDYGLIDRTGRILGASEVDSTRSAGLEAYLGSEDGAPCLCLAGDICVTQGDVHALLYAKAAITAAIFTLVHELGVELSDVRDLAFAGGFSRRLNLASAARVGIFPASLLGVARSVGNTAIEGLSALLLSDEANSAMDELVAKCGYVELSSSSDFEELCKEHHFFE